MPIRDGVNNLILFKLNLDVLIQTSEKHFSVRPLLIQGILSKII